MNMLALRFIPKSLFSQKTWLQSLIITVVLLGSLFRFVNLGEKPVWGDEAFTFETVSGYPRTELIERFSEREILVEELQKYLYPNSDKNFGDVLKIARKDVHPPLYYFIANLWLRSFGHSVATLRSLSAAISLLTLPLVYWLSIELLKFPSTAQVATALVAVSPFHIIYAQEARSYSLLSFAVVLSAAALLRALRVKTKTAWSVLTGTLTLGFYTHLFFILAFIGYAIYVFLVNRCKWTREVKSFLIAFVLSFLFFSPWVISLILSFANFQASSAWIGEQHLGILGAVRCWTENISLAFFDLWIGTHLGVGRFSLYFLALPILLLVVYAVLFLGKTTPIQARLFIFTFIGSTALSLILADLAFGGNRQIWPRYLIPCYWGMQLVVAHLLAVKITAAASGVRQRKIWAGILVAVVTGGVISCLIMSQAETWWNKYGGEIAVTISGTVNQSDRPVLIVQQPALAWFFIYDLDPEVELLFLNDENQVKISNFANKQIYLVAPTAELRSKFTDAGFKPAVLSTFPAIGAFEGLDFWRVNKLGEI